LRQPSKGSSGATRLGHGQPARRQRELPPRGGQGSCLRLAQPLWRWRGRTSPAWQAGRACRRNARCPSPPPGQESRPPRSAEESAPTDGEPLLIACSAGGQYPWRRSDWLPNLCGVLSKSCSFYEVLAKGPRRDAGEATELLGEVAGTREAHLPSHHAYRQVGVREQRFGSLDPLSHDVLVRGETCRKLEHPREVVGAHTHLVGNLGE